MLPAELSDQGSTIIGTVCVLHDRPVRDQRGRAQPKPYRYLTPIPGG